MNLYEREYFVSRIRAGFYALNLDGFNVKVLTPTLEDEYLANEVFLEAFDHARKDELMVEEEMFEWMVDRGLWSSEKDEKIKTLKKDIEKLKIEIFNARNKEAFRENIRLYIRAAEKATAELMAEKNENFSRTCEGIATQEKAVELFKRCCFVGGEPLDFNSVDINAIFYQYHKTALTDGQVRELARSEPWRSLYILKDDVKLFANGGGRQLSLDQRSMLIWSRMYDNVQESMECPTDEVIEDDDMLDGWFIVQRRKHESERAQSDLEKRTQNSKISSSAEIFVFTDSKKEAESINNMNSVNSQMIKKERTQTIKSKGGAVDLDFQDQQIKMSNKSNEQFKGKFRG
jgi:hypothetical protein